MAVLETQDEKRLSTQAERSELKRGEAMLKVETIQDNPKEALCGDCKHYGIDSCVLTNGKEWVMYLTQIADCKKSHSSD